MDENELPGDGVDRTSVDYQAGWAEALMALEYKAESLWLRPAKRGKKTVALELVIRLVASLRTKEIAQ